MKNLTKIFAFINHHPLAKRHRLKAYYRFISWQLSQLLDVHEVVVPFVGSTKLLVRKGLKGATGNIYTGLHEFDDMSFLLHFLRQDDLFFDVGANVGAFTILASGHVRARTIAFEPVPSTFIWLQKNIALNNLNDIVVARNIGVGSAKSTLFFTKNLDTINHVDLTGTVDNPGDLLAVPVSTLDSITLGAGIPILMKIDVEGFETEVVKGMASALSSTHLKAIIIELNGSGARYGFDEKKIHATLISHNFLPYSYDPFARKLKLLKASGVHNTIYLRDLNFVTNRLITAEKLQLFSESF